MRINAYQALPVMTAGSRLTLVVSLKPAHGLANEAGMDGRRLLLGKGITATGNLRRVIQIEPVQTGLRERWLARAAASWQDLSQGPLLAALTFGEQGGITDEQWSLFRGSGLTHIIAISGQHIALVAVLGWWLGRLFGLRERFWSPCCLPPSTAGWPVLRWPPNGPLSWCWCGVCCAGDGGNGRPIASGCGPSWCSRSGILFRPLFGQFWLSFLAVALLLVASLLEAKPGSSACRACCCWGCRCNWRCSRGLPAVAAAQSAGIAALLHRHHTAGARRGAAGAAFRGVGPPAVLAGRCWLAVGVVGVGPAGQPVAALVAGAGLGTAAHGAADPALVRLACAGRSSAVVAGGVALLLAAWPAPTHWQLRVLDVGRGWRC